MILSSSKGLKPAGAGTWRKWQKDGRKLRDSKHMKLAKLVS
jgi:hypothetical protein